MEIECQYCGGSAKRVDSSVVYGRSYGDIFLCAPCDAYVGVHKSSGLPLGKLANRELRDWRKKAHAAFDPTWKRRIKNGNSKSYVRNKAYSWLASKLDIPREACHIAMFDCEQCKKVCQICEGKTVIELVKEGDK